MDRLDYRIVRHFSEEPGTSVLAAARELEVARPTVQSRLNRLREAGVLVDILPKLAPEPMGYPVQAMVMAQIEQRVWHDDLWSHLEHIPEVIDCCTMAGEWDLLMRVVARSNTDLQRVIDELGELEGIVRTTTSIVLRELARDRTLPLMDAATADADR